MIPAGGRGSWRNGFEEGRGRPVGKCQRESLRSTHSKKKPEDRRARQPTRSPEEQLSPDNGFISHLIGRRSKSGGGLELVELFRHNGVVQSTLRGLGINHLRLQEHLALAVILQLVPLALAHEAVGTLRHGTT